MPPMPLIVRPEEHTVYSNHHHYRMKEEEKRGVTSAEEQQLETVENSFNVDKVDSTARGISTESRQTDLTEVSEYASDAEAEQQQEKIVQEKHRDDVPAAKQKIEQPTEHIEDPADVSPPPSQKRAIQRQGSILRNSHEESFIHDKRARWKQLPKPDLEAIRNTKSAKVVQTVDNSRKDAPRRSVSFYEVRIRSYEQTIGDNPSVSYGTPISLDWDYEEMEPLSLDDYEKERGPRRNPREMMLNYYNRKNLLAWRFGYSEEEIKAAEKQANKAKAQRALTKCLLSWSPVEEVVQSAVRKAKRVSSGRRK